MREPGRMKSSLVCLIITCFTSGCVSDPEPGMGEVLAMLMAACTSASEATPVGWVRTLDRLALTFPIVIAEVCVYVWPATMHTQCVKNCWLMWHDRSVACMHTKRLGLGSEEHARPSY